MSVITWQHGFEFRIIKCRERKTNVINFTNFKTYYSIKFADNKIHLKYTERGDKQFIGIRRKIHAMQWISIPDRDIFIAVPTLMIRRSFCFWKQIWKSPFLGGTLFYSTDLKKFPRFHLIRSAGNSSLLKIFQEMQRNIRFHQPIFLPFTRGFIHPGPMSFNNVRDNSSLAKIKKIFYHFPFSALPADNNFLK